MNLDDLITRFAHERQLANAYMALARERLKSAKELGDRIQREITRKPLTTKDRARLVKLIETGEIEYQGPDNEPF